MYQTLDIERPQVASSFSPVILGVISFAGAFFGTLLISSLSSPFTNQWVPNMQSVAATRVPFVAPVQRNEAVSRLEALQAIPLLAEPEPHHCFNKCFTLFGHKTTPPLFGYLLATRPSPDPNPNPNPALTQTPFLQDPKFSTLLFGVAGWRSTNEQELLSIWGYHDPPPQMTPS